MPEMLLNQGKQIKAQFARLGKLTGGWEQAAERQAIPPKSRLSDVM